MDADGVDVSIVYPTVGLLLYSVPDTALLSEIFRGFNDWLAKEFCRGEPKRLKGIAMINVDDVQEGVRELQRSARWDWRAAWSPSIPGGEGVRQPDV